jgi:hypothetical protein
MTRIPAFLKIAQSAALLLLAPLALGAAPGGGATITYQRIFKDSKPEFIEIKVKDDGQASYDIRQLADEADPQPLEMSQALRERIFQLADLLHNFENLDLDVHKHMAQLGQKTLRYENGATVHEAKFNYTINHDAGQLEVIFEGLAQQQEDSLKLDQELRYDHLGVNDALREFEDDLDRHQLPEPQSFLPVLDRIAANSQLLDIARQRARAIAERIRTATPGSPSQAQSGAPTEPLN